MGFCANLNNYRHTFMLICVFMVTFMVTFQYVGSLYNVVLHPTDSKFATFNRSVFSIVSNGSMSKLFGVNSSSIMQKLSKSLRRGPSHSGEPSIATTTVMTVVNQSLPLPLCNVTPPHLEGPIPVIMEPLEWAELNKLFPEVEEGGRWRPKHCKSRHHMGIVIPYRDRDAHLRTYLRHMHKFWAKQELDYGVYVIEQDSKSLFNRGMLMNIGFAEARKVANYSCFIFSDVDLVPEDDRNIYGCPEQPRHLSVSIDSHGYKLMYKTLFGGVENFRTEHYQAVNGFSNKYFGWGAEDDDLYKRIIRKKFKLTRPPIEIARYKMQTHKKARGGPYGMKFLGTAHTRITWDGLNSLKYKVVKYEKRPLYTFVSVVIDQNEILNSGPGHT